MLEVGACPFPSAQGSQLLLAGTALALREAGHAVRIVAYGHGAVDVAGDAGSLPARCLAAGVELDRAPAPWGYARLRSGPDLVKPVVDLLMARTIGLALTTFRPDVVHAHNHEAVLAARLAVGRSRLPLVYGQHTLLAEELPTYLPFRGRAPGWTRQAPGGGAPGPRVDGAVDRAVGRAGAALDALVARAADGAVALSPRGLAALTAVDGPRALVLPGLDRADLRPVDPLRAGPGPWLVYAGTPDAFQDLEVLPAVLDHLPGWRLLVVSHGAWPPGALGGATAGWAEGRVHHVQARWSAARRWIAGADVAIVPRRVCAGFPMKLLHYAACGLRTVVGNDLARGVPGEEVVDAAGVELAAGLAAGVRRAAAGPRVSPNELEGWTWDRRVPELERLFAHLPGCVTPSALRT